MTTAVAPRYCISTSRVGTNLLVEVAGSLDWRSAPEVRAATSVPARRILLDLGGLDRMDSAGTGAVIAASLRARAAGTDLAVLTGPAVADVVEAVGLSGQVPRFCDREAARAWITGAGPDTPSGR